MGTCVHFSRSLPSNSWWQTMVGWQVLSRPSAAEGGGRRPAFTGLATQPYLATEVDGWQHKLSRVSQNRAAVQGVTAAELGTGQRGGLAWSVGDEPDVDQRIDAEVSSSGAASGRRRTGSTRRRRIEIGDLAPLRGVIGGAHEGMDCVGPRPSRHHGGAD